MKTNKFFSKVFINAAIAELNRVAREIESVGAFAHPLNYTADELTKLKFLHNRLLYLLTASGEISMEYYVTHFYIDSDCGQFEAPK